MRLNCPWCGTRNIEEFTYGGDASVKRPGCDDQTPEAWLTYLYERDNIKGRHHEFWHHERGCRQWIIAVRDTATHQLYSTRLAASRAK